MKEDLPAEMVALEAEMADPSFWQNKSRAQEVIKEIGRLKEETAGQKDESFILERLAGIEPTSSPWEGDVIPFNYSRIFCYPTNPAKLESARA